MITLTRLWFFTLFSLMLTSFFDSEQPFIANKNTINIKAAHLHDEELKTQVSRLSGIEQYTINLDTLNQQHPINPSF